MRPLGVALLCAYAAINAAIFATHWPYGFGGYAEADGELISRIVGVKDCKPRSKQPVCLVTSATYRYEYNGTIYYGDTIKNGFGTQYGNPEIEGLMAIPEGGGLGSLKVYVHTGNPSESQLLSPRQWGFELFIFMLSSIVLAILMLYLKQRQVGSAVANRRYRR